MCRYVFELMDLYGSMMVLEELPCVRMCINGHVMMHCRCFYRYRMMLHVDHANLHVMEIIHGTLVELSTRYSLGLLVYAYEETFSNDVMAR